MAEIICIVCPKGCRLAVDEENAFAVSGNACPRGAEYGKKELQNPTRVLTSTVKLTGARLCRLPVKTDGEIPKDLVRQAARLLDEVNVSAPVQIGAVIVSDIMGCGVNVVATRSISAVPSAENGRKN